MSENYILERDGYAPLDDGGENHVEIIEVDESGSWNEEPLAQCQRCLCGFPAGAHYSELCPDCAGDEA